MTVAVVSSCYGGFDDLPQPTPQTVAVAEWVMVTDAPTVPAGWRHVHQSRPWMSPRLAAKHAKCLPFDYTTADIAIWVDASAQMSSGFVGFVLDVLADNDLAMWRHPDRGDIRTEANLCIRLGKYPDQPTADQAAHYDHPPGLWATGCIAWRDTPINRHLGAAWLAEQVRWSVQDQLSFPYVVREFDVKPVEFPQTLWRNDHIKFRRHRR